MQLDSITCADVLDYLRGLPDNAVNCVVTSPPYYALRDYAVEGQIGLEMTPAEYVTKITQVFQEVRRVLRDDGTCWVVLGDTWANDGKWGSYFNGFQSYMGEAIFGARTRRQERITGLPPKSLIGIPWRVAFALQDSGWVLRADIIWHKPNPMPESVSDRPTKAHEYVFLFTKSSTYWYDGNAIREPQTGNAHARGDGHSPKEIKRSDAEGAYIRANSSFHAATSHVVTLPGGRNKRSVWTVASEATPFAHFATFPRKLITPMILAGCPVGGLVLDPFMGSGTTALVARSLGRHFIGCDLNPEYVRIAQERLAEPYTLPLIVGE